MTPTTEILTITLDPKIWYRGKGSQGSKLLKFDQVTGARQQCCLGIAATACGVPDEVLLNRGELQVLLNRGELQQRPKVYDALPDGPLQRMIDRSHAGDYALLNTYNENDTDTGVTDAERVAAINRQVEPFGLRFVLGQ